MRARFLALEIQRGCVARQGPSILAKERGFAAAVTPESQTLIVLSNDPETIDDPSGEKATEVMVSLCAFVFSLLSSSVAAQEGRRRQFWPRKGLARVRYT